MSPNIEEIAKMVSSALSSFAAPLVALVLLIGPLVEVQGYASGAPSSSCTQPRPGHGSSLSLGYGIATNATTVTAGQTIAG